MSWSQTFSYDTFGNLSKSGTISFLPTYSYLTNQMTGVGSSTPTYDANGNATNDTSQTYAWDAAGHAVTINAVGLTYDALGRMVEQSKGANFFQIVYTPRGSKFAIMKGSALTKAFVSLTGGAQAVYIGSGLQYYRHSDWLGSSRFASKPNQTMYSDGAYAPFGESYAQTGTADLSFTGMNNDTVTNLYDFLYREYSPIQGRWPSPDPAGLAAVDPTDPQSWNRYGYVRNSPLNLYDSLGLSWLTACTGVYTGDGISWDCTMDWVDDPTPSPITGTLAPPPGILGGGGAGGGGNGGGGNGGGGNGGGGNGGDGNGGGTNTDQQPPQKPCYSGDSLTDNSVRFFSLLRLGDTLGEWIAGGSVKAIFFKTAIAGAKSAGGAESLGATALSTGGKFLGAAGAGAMMVATIADIDCHIGPVVPYTQK